MRRPDRLLSLIDQVLNTFAVHESGTARLVQDNFLVNHIEICDGRSVVRLVGCGDLVLRGCRLVAFLDTNRDITRHVPSIRAHPNAQRGVLVMIVVEFERKVRVYRERTNRFRGEEGGRRLRGHCRCAWRPIPCRGHRDRSVRDWLPIYGPCDNRIPVRLNYRVDSNDIEIGTFEIFEDSRPAAERPEIDKYLLRRPVVRLAQLCDSHGMDSRSGTCWSRDIGDIVEASPRAPRVRVIWKVGKLNRTAHCVPPFTGLLRFQSSRYVPRCACSVYDVGSAHNGTTAGGNAPGLSSLSPVAVPLWADPRVPAL